MFEYLKGYEIDGSDTSFYVVMPEQEKINEVVEYFLSIPLFEEFGIGFEANVWAPHRDGRISKPRKPEYVKQAIRDHEREAFYILAGCTHPSELGGDLKRDIYALSAQRVENHLLVAADEEEDDEAVEVNYTGEGSRNPSIGLDNFCDSFVLALVVNYGKPEDTEGEPDGYVINGDSYHDAVKQPGCMEFEITCGPSFIYEYAMYVVKQMSARFPELVFTGGLDCEGGFLHGCTYAISLYAYEMLTVEAGSNVEAVADVLRQLSENGILYPCHKLRPKQGRYNHRYYTSEEGLTTRINSGWDQWQSYHLDEYMAYLEEVQNSKNSLIRRKEDNALMFCTQKPAKKRDPVEWDWLAHVTAYYEKGVWMVELHIPPSERERIEAAIRA